MQLNFIDSGNEFDFGKNTSQSLKNPDDILKDSLNKYLNSHYFPKVNEKYYDGTFNKRIKFKGDFYNSLTYIFNSLLHGSGKFYNYIYYSIFYNRSNKKLGEYDNPLYSLFSNNCMQVSIDVLLKGKFIYFNDLYREALKLARNCVVPNLAYKGLNSFNALAISTNVTIAMLKNKIKWLKSYFD